MEKNELRTALGILGFELSTSNLNILFNRFSKKRKYMNIDDFAACVSRVTIMDGRHMHTKCVI